MILYFIKLGRFIEHKSQDKTKEAIKKLVQITPQQAILKLKNQLTELKQITNTDSFENLRKKISKKG